MSAGQDVIRGVDGRNEIDPRKLVRDQRRLSEVLHDGLSKPGGYGAFMLLMGALLLIFSVLMPSFMPGALSVASGFVFLIVPVVAGVIGLIYGRMVKRTHLPMRMPIGYPGKDYNNPNPGRTTFKDSLGTFFVGNERGTDEEIYLTSDDMLTHMCLFGTTGAGKTESLLSLAWNSLSMGSGLIFIDPKGTNKLALQVWSMCRMVGRDDDFLLINYSTGNRSITAFSSERLSNTSNPFSHGTSDFLSDIMNSLIPTSEGENAIFSERALSLMKTLMMGLVEMRDQGRLNLSVRTIRQWMTIDKCMEIMQDEMLSEATRESMRAYLNSVAGFNEKKGASEQGEDTLKQFGYAQAYFTRPLSSLTDTYGHVYGSLMGEVDFRDVVFNRRILVALLPSMEKAPPELKALGKVVLAAIRSAMSMGLGNNFEGDYDEMISSLPSASNVPNLVIADEYGYVATEGFAVTAAQARGLGFSVIFAGQDYAGFKRGSETEAEQILANTNTKLIMRLEDPESTWETIKKIAGEADVSVTGGFEISEDDATGMYRDSNQARTEKRLRVDMKDLRRQINGEMHMFNGDILIRGQMFFANPDIKSSRMVINRMIEIDPPTHEELSAKYGAIRDLREGFIRTLERINSGEIAEPGIGDEEESLFDRNHDESDPIVGTMAELIRIPGMDKFVNRREQGLVGMFLTFGRYQIPGEDAPEEALPPEKPSTAVISPEPDDVEPVRVDPGEPVRQAPPMRSHPSVSIDGIDGSSADDPADAGRLVSGGLSLHEMADGEEDGEVFVSDEPEEDEALAGGKPIPSDLAAKLPDEIDTPQPVPVAPAKPPYRPATESILSEQIIKLEQPIKQSGQSVKEFREDMEKQLSDAAEYPPSSVPAPNMQQKSRVLSSLEGLRKRGSKNAG